MLSNIKTRTLKKLNSFGLSHIIIPIVAVVAIGGIGTYLLGVNHADAAVPYLTCSSTYSSKKVASGKYNLSITQSYTNTGGGVTAAKQAFTSVGNGRNYGLAGTSQQFRNIPSLTHAKVYAWTSTYTITGVTSNAYIDGFSQYQPTNHKGDSRYFSSCSPANHRFSY